MLDDPGYPAGNAAAHFTDLRVVTAMLCLTWPASKDIAGLSAPALISRHVSELGIGNRSLIDRPPRPVTGDRKRQEASAFTWAHVTQGEPKLAPRPIEAGQPEPVRREWADRRSSTCYKLAFSGRIHYVELRKLLIDHGDRLARDIDGRKSQATNNNWEPPSTPGRHTARQLDGNTAVTDGLAR